MAYGAAADEENVLAYGSSKQAAAGSSSEPPKSHSLPVPPTGGPVAESVSSTQPIQSNLTAEKANLAVDYLRATWADCKPWDQFYSTSAINVPVFSVLSDRVKENLQVFRANYIIVATVWLSLAILSGIPTFLITGLLVFALERWATKRANKNGGHLSNTDRVVVAVVALLIVCVTHIVGYLIMSLFFTAVSVGAHACLHDEYAGIQTEQAPAQISTV